MIPGKGLVMRRFLTFLLCVVLLTTLLGCEQEIDPSLFAVIYEDENQITLTECDAATHILVTDEESALYGTVTPYFGKYTATDGVYYASSDGYFSEAAALRGIKTASDSDLVLSDSLWLYTYDSAKLRCIPSAESETAFLISSGEAIEISAVSFTDALYYAVTTDDTYGYINASAVKVSTDRVELEFYSAAESFSPVGAQLTIINNGEIVSSYAYGYADIESNTAMTADTKIRVASLSKVAFAIACMKLQDEGVVDIDESLGTYWGIDIPNSSVSLRTILTHTSSIKTLSSYYDRDGLENKLASSALYNKSKKPGTQKAWEYNNFAIGVGGATLEVAAGRTMQDYLTETVFEPMSIEAAYRSADLPEGCVSAALYSDDGVRKTDEALTLSVSDIPGDNAHFFAGGLNISSEDYAKLLIMLMNDGVYDGNRILSEEAVSEIETEYFEVDDSVSQFSQCLVLRKAQLYDRTLYYHTGNAYGTIAFASYDPESGDGVVIITTGMNTARSSNGIYKMCNIVSNLMYAEIL